MSAIAVKYAPEHSEQAETVPRADIQAENILLVDDLPANLLVYQTILDELGQNLVMARSGEEALKLVLRQEFAVILLDVNMPTMNGFETAALIRKRRKSAHTPIIFLTAFTDEMNTAQGYASGAVDFLPTPIVPEVLKAKVRVFIELSQMRRQVALQAEERVRREAAEDSARKSAFLAKVSETLARTQSQSDLLRALAQLPVPHLADFTAVCLRDEDGRIDWAEWHPAAAFSETSTGSPVLALADFPWLQRATSEVISTGRSRCLDKASPLGAALILPLAIQSRPCGALTLLRKHSGWDQASDGPLADELAYRAGVALENVMLMQKIREADRRKDEFLGMLAHELRNPLGPIYNSVQLLKLLGLKEPRLVALQDIIDRQAKHMGRLIDDLLDATRLAHGKILLRKERCDLTEIVRQTAEDYRSIFDANGLHLNIFTPDISLWVHGDRTRLVQAVGNLLHNANKFTKPGGAITVRLQLENEGPTAAITVTDTGIGIEPKMLPYIFDVFRQAEQGLDRSHGGLGLGLALVKGLVELHGGEVSAASAGPDQGAELAIRLPLEAMQNAIAPSPAAALVSRDEKYRILMIEDNPDAAESARMLLHLEGHDVRTVSTALAGLEVARTFRPQIVLCDIGLPGMDGYQIVRMIRQDAALASSYVIALTGYGREEDRKSALEAGFDLHLTKPIDYSHLRQALSLPHTKIN